MLNLHTLKPIDGEAIVRAARETGAVVTAEEHQIGALSGCVELDSHHQPRALWSTGHQAAIGVKDRFGESGAPWELVKEFEVSAEHIAQKAMELMAVKKKGAVGAGLVHA